MTCYLTLEMLQHWTITTGAPISGSLHPAADTLMVSLGTFHHKKMRVHVKLGLKRSVFANLGSLKCLSKKY